MNQELKAGFLVSVMIGLSVIFCPVAFGSGRGVQVLYFQPVKYDDSGPVDLYWLMNTSFPNGPALVDDPHRTDAFCSPHLAEDFMFGKVNVTVFHEVVPSGRGEYILYLGMGVHEDGLLNMPDVRWVEKTLNVGSRASSFLVDFNFKVLRGEGLYVRMSIGSTYHVDLDFYWGNSTYPSCVSYEGEAIYVPEFPSLLTPLFIVVILTVIVYRRKLLKNNLTIQ